MKGYCFFKMKSAFYLFFYTLVKSKNVVLFNLLQYIFHIVFFLMEITYLSSKLSQKSLCSYYKQAIVSKTSIHIHTDVS